MITFEVVVLVLASVLAGWCEAAREALLFRNAPRIINPRWWAHPEESWWRKYKDNDPSKGESFPLSTTLLVWLTDGYHLVNTYTAWWPAVIVVVSPTLLTGAVAIAVQMLTMHICFRFHEIFIPKAG